MPIIPRASRRVETRPVPGAQLSPSAPAAAFQPAPVLPDLTGVEKWLDQQRLQADQVTVLEADNRLADTERELRRRALERRGKEAMGATAEALEAWEQAVGELEPTITNERARMGVRRAATARRNALESALESHAAREAEKFDAEEAEKGLANRQNDALADFRDPARVEAALAASDAILGDYAKRRGWGPEQLQAQRAERRSQIRVGVIEAMLANGEDRAATAYLAEHRAEIQGDKLAAVDRALEQGSYLGTGQRNADGIRFGPGRATTRQEAYARARAIADPRERQATEQQLDIGFAREDRAERDAYDALLEDAQGYVAAGQMPPPALMAQLKPSAQATVRSLLRANARGTPIVTDKKTMYELMLEAGSSDPAVRQKFAERNLFGEFGDKLSQSDLEQLTKEQNGIRSGQPAGAAVRGFVTTNQAFTRAIKGSGVKAGSPEETEIRDQVDVAMRDQLTATGQRQLTPKETQEIIDRVVLNHFYVDEPGVDPHLRGPQLTPAQRGKAYIPLSMIPPTEAAAIREIMAKQGIPTPSDREIERAYAARKLGDRDAFDDITSAVGYVPPSSARPGAPTGPAPAAPGTTIVGATPGYTAGAPAAPAAAPPAAAPPVRQAPPGPAAPTIAAAAAAEDVGAAPALGPPVTATTGPLKGIHPVDVQRIREIMFRRGIPYPDDQRVADAFAAEQKGAMGTFDRLVSGPDYIGPPTPAPVRKPKK